MDGLPREELSLNMRIPAEKCYLDNAVLTLEGICDHFAIEQSEKERMSNALRKALGISIDFSYLEYRGLFDLKFLVFKDKLQITVEDFMLNSKPDNGSVYTSENAIKEALSEVEEYADKLIVFSELGRNSCYSMQFNFNSEVE